MAEFTEGDLLIALLQHNYFPAQKTDKEELPPVIHSIELTEQIARRLAGLGTRFGGYDQVEYRLTRFTNVSRPISIPHPLPYIKLALAFHQHWDKFEHICNSKSSLVIPKLHSDGRIIIMDYSTSKENARRDLEMAFGKKFQVTTDIANFFPSIYSHSIPWALVGQRTAKRNRSPNKWFNKIDKLVQSLKRGETNGIAIGPAISNILSETILYRIDRKLKGEGYSFYRFVDDYSAFFETYEQGETFIRRLSEELAKYKLVLNSKKTEIEKLPATTSDEWILELATRLPYGGQDISALRAIRFLDFAIEIHRLHKGGSVIKYAVKSIMHSIKGESIYLVLKYLLGLCIHYPVLIPLLDPLLDQINMAMEPGHAKKLEQILKEHTRNRRSDSMAWLLFYYEKYGMVLSKEMAESVIETKDCIAILMVYRLKQHESMVVEFAKSLDREDLYLLDQYWLLLYHLYFDGKIPNPYKLKSAYSSFRKKNESDEDARDREVQVFDILKKEKVRFMSR